MFWVVIICMCLHTTPVQSKSYPLHPPCAYYLATNGTLVQYSNSIEAAKSGLSGVDANGYFCPASAGTIYDNSKKKPYVGVELVAVFNASTDTAYYKYGTPEYFPGPDEYDTGNVVCDCHSQSVKWAAEHLDLTNDNSQQFVRYIKAKDPKINSWDPKTQGSPCDYVQLGNFV